MRKINLNLLRARAPDDVRPNPQRVEAIVSYGDGT